MRCSQLTSLLLFQLVVLYCAAKICDENVLDSPSCAQYGEESCNIPERATYCQRYCGICNDGKKASQTSLNNNKQATREGNCKDASLLCGMRKRSCKTSFIVRSMCNRSCGLCSPPVATVAPPHHAITSTSASKTTLRLFQWTPEEPKTPPTRSQRRKLPTCNINIPDSPICPVEPNVCELVEKMKFCQRYCGICPKAPPSTKTLPPSTTTLPPSTTTTLPSTTTSPPSTTTLPPSTTTTPPSTTTTPLSTTTTPPSTTRFPPSTVAEVDRETGTHKGPLLIQQPQLLSSAEKDSSCVDLTNFLCPMFKCMGDNNEFRKLCDKQTLYICDRQ